LSVVAGAIVVRLEERSLSRSARARKAIPHR
jgi:hypothetical protein